MKKIKIYQVFESYPLFYQPYISPTLELLASQDQVHSKIIAFQGDKGQDDIDLLSPYYRRKVKEFFFNKTNNYNKKLNLLEIKAIKEKVNIIHIQHSYLFNKVISILNLPKESRPKVVITLRGGDTYIKPWVSQRWKDFFNNYGDKVDAFIVMSEDQKEYLSRWNVPLQNIHVIPISFGKKFECRAKYPTKESMKIVSVFRMCWEKNIADNLRLVKQIKDLGVDVQYDVYGDGKDIGQLYYLLDRYDLNDCVNVKGKVENEILKNNLKDYDFILQLSHSESFGMSVVEAQTHGVPAIVSNRGGLPEIVIEKTGLVVDLIDFKDLCEQVFKLWSNQEMYLEFSKKSIENAQSKYDVDREVSLLKTMYQKILDK